jgi:hypothetical protein
MGLCKLCEAEADLELSHIIPKFVFRHLKKTSPTGHMRSADNPNRSVQDGLKVPFLCGDCEDLFSVWETKFANEIFFKYQTDRQGEFRYDSWLAKYLASVSFRVLAYAYHNGQLGYLGQRLLEHVPIALGRLRAYLLGQMAHPGEQRQLLVLLDKPVNSQDSTFSMYVTRAIEEDIVTNDAETFVYIKYLNFLQLSPIKLSKNKGWRTARISAGRGVLKPIDQELSGAVVQRMRAGAETLSNSRTNVSEKQGAMIKKRVEGVPADKLLSSPIVKSVDRHD